MIKLAWALLGVAGFAKCWWACKMLVGLQIVGGNSLYTQLTLATACLTIAVGNYCFGKLLFVYGADIVKNLYCAALSS